MFYIYDTYGRFSGISEIATERSTEVEPTELTPDWNWNGIDWVFVPQSKLQLTPIVNNYNQTNEIKLSPKEQKLKDLADYRYEKEIAGITLNGSIIRTDVGSQAKINGAWSAAQMNPAILIDWKGENGWIQIDATTITVIAMAVANHVQFCFTQERLHYDAINLLTTYEEINNYNFKSGW